MFLPFPTQLLDADAQHDAVTNGLYIATMAAASASSLAQQLIINRTPAIRAPGFERKSILSRAVPTGLLLAAWAVAVLAPDVGLWSLLLLFLQPPLQWLARRLAPRLEQAA